MKESMTAFKRTHLLDFFHCSLICWTALISMSLKNPFCLGHASHSTIWGTMSCNLSRFQKGDWLVVKLHIMLCGCDSRGNSTNKPSLPFFHKAQTNDWPTRFSLKPYSLTRDFKYNYIRSQLCPTSIQKTRAQTSIALRECYSIRGSIFWV